MCWAPINDARCSVSDTNACPNAAVVLASGATAPVIHGTAVPEYGKLLLATCGVGSSSRCYACLSCSLHVSCCMQPHRLNNVWGRCYLQMDLCLGYECVTVVAWTSAFIGAAVTVSHILTYCRQHQEWASASRIGDGTGTLQTRQLCNALANTPFGVLVYHTCTCRCVLACMSPLEVTCLLGDTLTQFCMNDTC